MRVQVLGLHGIGALAVNGTISFAQRHKNIKEFRDSDKIRVLLISQVANAGLNLSVADTVIFLVN